MQDYRALFKKTDLQITDPTLINEAFTHRSAVNENSKLRIHNERLEFLGDAVLELITTEFLYHKYPEKPEGDLTNLRSALVKGDHLAEVAKKLNFGKYLILSKGEERSGGRTKEYLLANTVESFIGAIYLSTSLAKAKKFIKNFILIDLPEILKKRSHIDAKSEFQELSQAQNSVTPTYKVISETGRDHEKTFIIGAYLGKKQCGKGKGRSKKEAQNAAAENALKNKTQWLK
jgi:ribonuclease-3